MGRTTALLFGCSLLLLLSATESASAAAAAAAPGPAKQVCVDAATRGQIQRDDLKLSAAAEAFEVCAASTCPPTVRKSCSEWLAEVKASIPTVRIHVADAAAIVAVVRIDGKDSSVDTPVSLDPGPHRVKVEAQEKDKLPFEEEFSLAAKEAKTIEVRFPVENKPPPPMKRPTPTLVWILGGVAIAGTASWATFGLLAKSETDRLTEQCAPSCSKDDRDGAFRLAAVADVSLVVAVVAVAAGAYFYFTRPSRPADGLGGATTTTSTGRFISPRIVF